MADVPPFIIDKPSLKISAHAPDTVPTTEIELQCSGRGLDVTVDQDENELTTFCGTYTNYGQEKWTVTLNAYTSFGTDGLWTLLRPCVGHIVTFELIPQGDEPVSVDNPLMSGLAMVKAFPFISGDQGNGSEVDVDFKVQGLPTFSTTPPTQEAAGTTTSSTQDEEVAVA